MLFYQSWIYIIVMTQSDATHTKTNYMSFKKLTLKYGSDICDKKSHKYAKYKIHPNIFLCKSWSLPLLT